MMKLNRVGEEFYRRQSLLQWICMATLVLVAVYVYWPAIKFEYVWDDRLLFLESSDLRPGAFRFRRIFEPILVESTYFRPLVLLSMVAEFFTVGVNSAVSHGVNIAIFVTNTLLVFLFGKSLVRTTAGEGYAVPAAMVGALAYLVSPVNVEPVAWVAGRFDLMVTTFVLLALYTGMFGKNRLITHVISPLCFFLALLCKEMAVTMPAILMILLWGRAMSTKEASMSGVISYVKLNVNDAGERGRYIAYFVAFLVYLSLRWYFIPQVIHTDRTQVEALTPLTWMAFVGHTELFYLRKLLFPFIDLAPHHPFDLSQFPPLKLAVGLLMPFITLAIIWATARKSALAAAVVVCVLVSLAPVLNLIPLTIAGSIGHERFLLLPGALVAIGIAVLMGSAFNAAAEAAEGSDDHARQRRVVTYIGIAMFAWISVSMINAKTTLPLWGNNYALWKWAYAKYPEDRNSRFMHSVTALDAGHVEEYLSLIEIPPTNADDALVYSSYLKKIGRCEEALHILSQIEHLEKTRFTKQPVYNIQAECYIKINRFDEALHVIENHIAQFPHFITPYFLKSIALYGLGRVADADAAYSDALNRAPAADVEIWSSYKKEFLKRLESERVESIGGK